MSNLAYDNQAYADEKLIRMGGLLKFEKLIKKIRDLKELSFFMVNKTHEIVKFDQAIFFELNEAGSPIIKNVSGLVDFDDRSDFTNYNVQLIKYVLDQPYKGQISLLDPQFLFDEEIIAEIKRKLEEQTPAKKESFFSKLNFFKSSKKNIDIENKNYLANLFEDYQENNIIWMPFQTVQGIKAGLLFSRELNYTQADLDSFKILHETYAHCYFNFAKTELPFHKRFIKYMKKNGLKIAIALAVVSGLFLEVHQTVLAPLGVVAIDPAVVNCPINGVVEKVIVKPNQKVQKGDLLVELDATNINNQEEVAKKAMSVAIAEFESTEKRSFMDQKLRSELNVLKARIQEKMADLKFAREMKKKLKIIAPRDGIAVFNSVDDIKGRPMTTGQKIMSIADPKKIEFEIWLPVEQAIPFPKKAKIYAFLNIDPLNPIEGELKFHSYEARHSATGIFAYRLSAKVSTSAAVKPRIGLEGTAKIYGNKVTILEFITHRPLAVIRKTLGI